MNIKLKLFILITLILIVITFPYINNLYLVKYPKLITKKTNIYSSDPVWNLADQYKYGNHPQNVLYIVKPEESKKNGKFIIFIHGGTFLSRYATDDYFTPIIKFFSAEGYTVSAVEYRSLARNSWKTVINDIKKGITASFNLYEKKSEEIILIGASAGATASALLLYSNKYPNIPGIDKFIGIVGLYSPQNVPESVNNYMQKFSKDKVTYSSFLRFEANNKISKSNAPALLIEVSSDDCDNFANTSQSHAKKLSRFLKIIGIKSTISQITSYNKGYNTHIGSLKAIAEKETIVTEDLNKFFISD